MRSSVADTSYSPEARVRDVKYGSPLQPQMPNSRRMPPKPVAQSPQRSLAPAEGWVALLLLTIAVYSVVFSIIGAEWVSNSSVLLWSPIIGVGTGLLVAKLPRWPQAILHLAACLLGHWFSVWLTSTIAFHISWLELLGSIRALIVGGMNTTLPNSEVVFFFYLSFLCFFLGYFGSWLIYRAHLPWLVALVYCSILLVNLNYGKHDQSYLMLVLLAALLPLVARVQLAGQIAQWSKEGLHTDRPWLRTITWRCMQIACVISVLTLLLGWLLPTQTQPDAGRTFWDRVDTAWTNIINGHVSLQDLGSLTQPYQTPTNFFSDQLTISGSVRLPTGEVLNYTGKTARYLEGFTYDHFDGHTWSTSLTSSDSNTFQADAPLQLDTVSDNATQIKLGVTLVTPPEGVKHYLFGPAQPASFDVDTVIYSDGTAGAWAQRSPLVQGEHYNVTSTLPVADPQVLSQAPLPADNPAYWQINTNSIAFPQRYLQIPQDLSPHDVQLVEQWTKGAKDAYTALKLIEQHLSDQAQFTYSVDNAPIPSNVDVVDWLLKTRQGYCTYYASAMATMARLLNIPTRVVNGFSPGQYDAQRKVWVVNGTDAHSWVQAYFPNYGWISFDPTPGYTNSAGTGTQPQPSPVVTRTPVAPGVTATPHKPKAGTPPDQTRSAGGTDTGKGIANQGMLLGLSITVLLLSLLIFLAALLSYWWRNLYAHSTFVAGIYWRFCRVASWAGLAPQKWQTPYEYSRMISQRMPQKSSSLWHLTDLFVRDRWGPPQHITGTNEAKDVERLQPSLRGMMMQLLLRRVKK